MLVDSILDQAWMNELVLFINFSSGLLSNSWALKVIILALLILELGMREHQLQKLDLSVFKSLFYLMFGLAMFLFSNFWFYFEIPFSLNLLIYGLSFFVGYWILRGTMIRLIEYFLISRYINYPEMVYILNGIKKLAFVVNPFRGILVTGNPGSGKTYGVIQPLLYQSVIKGLGGVIYDYKYPDLTKLAFNIHKAVGRYGDAFYVFNPNNLAHSHRVNPLSKTYIQELADAREVATATLLNLNKGWVVKSDDFFIDSSINYLTAVIWYLAIYEEGQYCTLGHVILMVGENEVEVIEKLSAIPALKTILTPFTDAINKGALEQLAGQLATLKLGLSKLVNPNLFWLTAENDFHLQVNNKKAPQLICLANNPKNEGVNSAVLGMLLDRVCHVLNKQFKDPSFLLLDELSSVYIHHLDRFLATVRSNRVITIMGVQDISQLQRDYGAEQAEVIFNMAGNLITGAVRGASAEKYQSMATSKSYTITAADIAQLNQGELFFLLADNSKLPVIDKINCDFIKVDPKIEEYKNGDSIPLIHCHEDGSEISKEEWADITDLHFRKTMNDIKKILKL